MTSRMLLEIVAPILGHYAGPGGVFSVVRSGGEFLLRFPAVPSGFEPRLVGEGEQWVIRGGEFDGAAVSFTEEGVMAGGRLVFSRTDQPPPIPPGSGLEAPRYVEDPRCEGLWAGCPGDGGVLMLPADLPVHRFVQWLMRRDQVIFHGSGSRDIEVFRARRASTELEDPWGRGNLAAVYGTHDGLWAMFFAVLDRERLRGSMRSGVRRFSGSTGETLHLYQFSVSSDSRAEAPWSGGALYLLPRERFRRLELYPDGPLSWEWTCPDEVSPIARLLVEPEDFPFLDRVGGHDDTVLFELQDRWGSLRRATIRREELEEGFRFEVSLDPADLERWAELVRRFYPQATVEFSAGEGTTLVELWGPPALLDVERHATST